MKFIKRRIIKGNPYYYFELSYTLLNQKYRFSKYLGTNLPENLKVFIDRMFLEVSKFIEKKISEHDVPYFPYQSMKYIERSRLRHILLNHELFQNNLRLFRTLFYILFVLNSNRAEGSKVTQSNIEELINKRISPRTIIEKEILNSINAINFAFSRNMAWNEKNIKEIHKYLFGNIHPELAGQYKKVNNIVNNQPTVNWENVSKSMKNLLGWYKKHKRTMYPPQLALEFHWRFEEIHPFEDGNGRVGRILLNRILLERGYAPVVFFSENHRSYCSALLKATSGQKAALAKHYVKSVKKTERSIDSYRKSEIIKGGSTKVGAWEISHGKIRINY